MTLLDAPIRHDDSSILERLDSGDELLEFVDGQLVEKLVAKESNTAAGNLIRVLGNLFREKPIAVVYPEQTFQCFGSTRPDDPKRVRRPDVSVVLIDRARTDQSTEGHFTIRPDIVAEFISPGESVYDLEDKLADYDAVGVPIVLVCSPRHKTVRIIHHGQPPSHPIKQNETLSLDPVLPGITIPVAEIFWSALEAR